MDGCNQSLAEEEIYLNHPRRVFANLCFNFEFLIFNFKYLLWS